MQSKKLDISCQLPETYLSGDASVQASCATDASDVAKFSATFEAHAGHLTTTATANKPGTTNTEFELTGRQAVAMHDMCPELILDCKPAHVEAFMLSDIAA